MGTQKAINIGGYVYLSILIDKKYINFISHRLDKFEWKQGNLANCRCPVCGDSTRSNLKKRFYLFQHKNSYCVKCHNCGFSSTFNKFLEKYDVNLFRDYLIEIMKDKRPLEETPEPNPNIDYVPKFFNDDVFSDIERISSLPENHPAVKFLKDRKIPDNMMKELYYTDDFGALATKINPETSVNLIKEPRIIIPFRDQQKKLFAVQGRALTSSSLRYITVKCKDAPKHKIYGLDKVDFSKPFFVVEGPFDSMFLENSIAMCGSSMSDFPLNKENAIIIYDNEPRNVDIVTAMRKVVDSGFKACVWPSNINQKDINDMVLEGINVSEVINNNTFAGLSLRMKFYYWKKCEERNWMMNREK